MPPKKPPAAPPPAGGQQSMLSRFFRPAAADAAVPAAAAATAAAVAAAPAKPPAMYVAQLLIPAAPPAAPSTGQRARLVAALAAASQGREEGSDGGDGDHPAAAAAATAGDRGVVLTPLEAQVVELKRAWPGTMLLVETGYRYRAFGPDAIAAARVLGLYAHRDHFFMVASLPTHRVGAHVRRLVQAGLRVGVVRQAETAAQKAAGVARVSSTKSAPFARTLAGLYTPGTLVDDDVIGSLRDAGAAAEATTRRVILSGCELLSAERGGEGGGGGGGNGGDGDNGGDGGSGLALAALELATLKLTVYVGAQREGAAAAAEAAADALAARLRSITPVELLLPPSSAVGGDSPRGALLSAPLRGVMHAYAHVLAPAEPASDAASGGDGAAAAAASGSDDDGAAAAADASASVAARLEAYAYGRQGAQGGAAGGGRGSTGKDSKGGAAATRAPPQAPLPARLPLTAITSGEELLTRADRALWHNDVTDEGGGDGVSDADGGDGGSSAGAAATSGLAGKGKAARGAPAPFSGTASGGGAARGKPGAAFWAARFHKRKRAPAGGAEPAAAAAAGEIAGGGGAGSDDEAGAGGDGDAEPDTRADEEDRVSEAPPAVRLEVLPYEAWDVGSGDGLRPPSWAVTAAAPDPVPPAFLSAYTRVPPAGRAALAALAWYLTPFRRARALLMCDIAVEALGTADEGWLPLPGVASSAASDSDAAAPPPRHLSLIGPTAYDLDLLSCRSFGGSERGSLLWVLNHTRTPFGWRVLREWVARPLADAADINARLDAVACLAGHHADCSGSDADDAGCAHALRVDALRGLHARLLGCPDLDRLLARVVAGSAGVRQTLELLGRLTDACDEARSHGARLQASDATADSDGAAAEERKGGVVDALLRRLPAAELSNALAGPLSALADGLLQRAMRGLQQQLQKQQAGGRGGRRGKRSALPTASAAHTSPARGAGGMAGSDLGLDDAADEDAADEEEDDVVLLAAGDSDSDMGGGGGALARTASPKRGGGSSGKAGVGAAPAAARGGVSDDVTRAFNPAAEARLFPRLTHWRGELVAVAAGFDSELEAARAALRNRRSLSWTRLRTGITSSLEYLVELPRKELESPLAPLRVPAEWREVSTTQQVRRYHTPGVLALLARLALARDMLALEAAAAWRAWLGMVTSAARAPLRAALRVLGEVDALAALATTARLPGYVRPVVLGRDVPPLLHITAGRHAALELLGGGGAGGEASGTKGASRGRRTGRAPAKRRRVDGAAAAAAAAASSDVIDVTGDSDGDGAAVGAAPSDAAAAAAVGAAAAAVALQSGDAATGGRGGDGGPASASAAAGWTYVPTDFMLGPSPALARDGLSSDLAPRPAVCVLSGPNMGGKSTAVRMAATVAVLAHVGSYVPAEAATVSVLDAVATRQGASDDLLAGASTFGLECAQTAAILAAAGGRRTPRVLALLDELGRGTSTHDGMAIAAATVRHVATRLPACLAVFVTHYPELAAEADALRAPDGGGAGGGAHLAGNWHMGFIADGEGAGAGATAATAATATASRLLAPRLTFLYTLAPGPAPASFGLHVARMAGLPASVLSLAARKAAQMLRGAVAVPVGAGGGGRVAEGEEKDEE